MNQIISQLKKYSSYLIAILVAILLNVIHLPYYIMTPGGTIDLSKKVTVADNSINGSINLLYVSEYNATIPTLLLSYLFKDWDVEKIDEYQVSDETASDINERNIIMLNNSIQNAIMVAYQKAGKTIKIKNSTNYVIATTKENGFRVGDIVTEIDSHQVNSIVDIKEYVDTKEIGDKIQFTIERDDKQQTVESTVSEENGNKLIGIMLMTNYEFDLEPEIEFNFNKRESGASGGLMLALNIYDLISPEDLVKGRNIAGTGTIDSDGTVGEIDGIKYKIIGAARKKIDIVFVAEGNYDEAIKTKEKYNYDLKIVSVKTFDQAVAYLQNN